MISLPLKPLPERLEKRMRVNQSLARLTSARVGGPADSLLVAESVTELAEMAAALWQQETPFLVIGGGSNILVSDAGIRGVVILNRARLIRFEGDDANPTVWAESGANFGALARQACARGLSGLEWAVGIPGTVGGAVVGNAGAHGGDMAGNLVLAEILHRKLLPTAEGRIERMKESWPVERFQYQYRTSLLKQRTGQAVVLAARLKLFPSSVKETQAKAEVYTEHRHRTQPPGATMGSMFKNPAGDYAGRLIEAAGLKGTAIGDAEISTLHANFFINHGHATAQNIYDLIHLAQITVFEKFGVRLELEIELVGEWN